MQIQIIKNLFARLNCGHLVCLCLAADTEDQAFVRGTLLKLFFPSTSSPWGILNIFQCCSCEWKIIAVIIEIRLTKKHPMAFNNPVDSLDLRSCFNEWFYFSLEKMSNVSCARKYFPATTSYRKCKSVREWLMKQKAGGGG